MSIPAGGIGLPTATTAQRHRGPTVRPGRVFATPPPRRRQPCRRGHRDHRLQRGHDGPGAHAPGRDRHVDRGSDGARVDRCRPTRPLRRGWPRPESWRSGSGTRPSRDRPGPPRRTCRRPGPRPRQQRGDRVPGPERRRDERDRRRPAGRQAPGGRPAAGPRSAGRGLLGAGRGPGQPRLRGRRHQPHWLRPRGVPGRSRGGPDRPRWDRSSAPERHPRLVRRGRCDHGRVGRRCGLRRRDARCQPAGDRCTRLRPRRVRRPLDGRSGGIRGLPTRTHGAPPRWIWTGPCGPTSGTPA